ncbi:MAG: glycosyltransferase family 2 protein [Methylophilus methylotrophus]|uniref:Glycosyltransferase family 2 protein n=1 Tax=Methylophilus methylotrophus TaxID=17 RepID=A0A5C7WJ18_METME|nr:MAG: glycosyltransferase family 2 protein [Methylophilus methylotrophus]
MEESMSFQPEVSILMVNYHTVTELLRCLQSLASQQDVVYEVIIVDNSGDLGEREKLQMLCGPQVRCVFSNENLGFGRANNLAAEYANAELLLILNPDTTLQETTLLRRYIDRFYAGNAAMLAPLIVESSKHKLIYPRQRYPSQALCKKTDFSGLAGTVAWVLGACMMMRRQDYLRINGFDSEYFMYGEDADICWRIRAELGPIGFDQTLAVHHIGGASEKQAASLSKWMRKRQGQYLFFRKRYHPDDVLRIVFRQRVRACFKLVKNALLNLCWGTSPRRIDDDARSTATLVVTAELLG